MTYQRPIGSNVGFSGLCDALGRTCAEKVSDWLCKGYGLQPARTEVAITSNDVMSLEAISRPEHVSEANLAAIYASQLRDKARYCFDNKHWYLWNGEKWHADKQKQMLLHILEFVR